MLIEIIEIISKTILISTAIIANFVWIKHILFLKRTGGFKDVKR